MITDTPSIDVAGSVAVMVAEPVASSCSNKTGADTVAVGAVGSSPVDLHW